MDSILPERLLALVRPAFDLVLQRIRSLKRCVQAYGCKIVTPRYAPQFGSRLHFKRCQALPKEFLALQRLARLKCNLEPNCGAYLGVTILQPYACAQHGQMLDGRVLGASQVE